DTGLVQAGELTAEAAEVLLDDGSSDAAGDRVPRDLIRVVEHRRRDAVGPLGAPALEPFLQVYDQGIRAGHRCRDALHLGGRHHWSPVHCFPPWLTACV